jgi:hypothetical protein
MLCHVLGQMWQQGHVVGEIPPLLQTEGKKETGRGHDTPSILPLVTYFLQCGPVFKFSQVSQNSVTNWGPNV